MLPHRITFQFILVCAVSFIGFVSHARAGQALFVPNIDAELALLTPPSFNCFLGDQDRPSPAPSAKPGSFETATVRTDYAGNQPVSVLSPKELDSLFSELAANPKIPFEYALDGCGQRSYAVSRILEKKGIHCVQLYLEPRNGKFVGHAKIGSRAVDYTWNYHIAPAVFVRLSPKLAPMLVVLDPTLFKKPIYADDWRQALYGKYAKDKTSRDDFPAYFQDVLTQHQYVRDFTTNRPDHFESEAIADSDNVLAYLRARLEEMKGQK